METIVIVGGGAGGLELATRLGNSAGKSGRARVVLVDRWPAHFWKPLLHTVASGKHDPHVMEVDYAAQAAQHGFEFARGEVLAVDREAKCVSLAAWIGDDGADVLPARAIGYDKLVLALGSVTNYFGVPGAEQHVLTLDDVVQAETFRQRFVDGCIQASVRQAAGAPNPGIDIVIVGGGATGVELAAELSHSARTLAKYKVHALDPVRHVRIRILERGSLLLPHLHPRLSKRAARHLRALGIKVLLDTAVARVEAGSVVDTAGATYPSAITLWAAGVQAPPLCATLGLATNGLRQIAVGPSLQAADDPDVYAIGDCANVVCPILGKIPPRAQAAHQQALYLAQMLGRLPGQVPGQVLGKVSGQVSGNASAAPAPFSYRDYGSLVSLGPLAAVGMLTRSSGQKYAVGGAPARILYALLYRKHQMALHGVVRMSAQTLADWLRDKLMPPVRLH